MSVTIKGAVAALAGFELFQPQLPAERLLLATGAAADQRLRHHG